MRIRLQYCMLLALLAALVVQCAGRGKGYGHINHNIASRSTTNGCRDNWVSFYGSCYLFGHQTFTFLEAVSYCRLYGAHLVHIETPMENTFVTDHIRYLQKSDEWWIGLTDGIIEGDWRWLDTDTIPTYTVMLRTSTSIKGDNSETEKDWFPGEPNNNYQSENCAVIEYNFAESGRWNDRPCKSQAHPVCERTGAGGSGIIG